MATSTAAVSALMQKASQQYLECRRRVSAKAEEVATLDQEIQTLFERITDSSVTSAAKSVGRLELSVVAVEGDAPVDDAVISVEIDPEYEEPEAPVQEVAKAEEPKEEKTEEAAEESEKAEADEEAKEEGDEKTEEPKAEEAAVEEAAVDEEKAEAEEAAEAEKPAAPRRSVQWSDAESFPLNVVFDPVQSREAVVTIAIAAPAKDGEESEPVKEFRIPVSSLFKTGSINRWYVLKKVEHVHIDKAAITEVDDEAEPKETSTEEPVKEDAAPEAEKTEEEAEKPATEEEAEKPATEEAEKPATEEEAEKPAAEEEEKKAEESTEEDKKTEAEDDVKTMETAPELTLVAATATVESEDKVLVLKEGKLHVQVHFTMSEIEKLSQTAIALSQQKQEAEATLAVLEREAASLRTKYERLSASQRSLTANAGVVKPRSTLLGGRGLGAAAPRVEKSSYQKVKDSVAAVLTPQRTQVLTSFAIFVGSVALFHFQGDNLLA